MTRHVSKIAAALISKRRLITVTPVHKCKTLKEIDGGQSCIATVKKYGVAKNTVSHWLLKKAEIFDAIFSLLKDDWANGKMFQCQLQNSFG